MVSFVTAEILISNISMLLTHIISPLVISQLYEKAEKRSVVNERAVLLPVIYHWRPRSERSLSKGVSNARLGGCRLISYKIFNSESMNFRMNTAKC